MKTIDARGLACPEPVLLTKRTVDAGEKMFDVLVDDEIPVENIKRFCDSNNCSLTQERLTDFWKLSITRNAAV
ncbi:MAG: sulfurtransferase TusA family protein [Peptococcaceae bacterium]|nr:sulfurtransferase TusA family protein [Peptococcaceae bacterium]